MAQEKDRLVKPKAFASAPFLVPAQRQKEQASFCRNGHPVQSVPTVDAVNQQQKGPGKYKRFRVTSWHEFSLKTQSQVPGHLGKRGWVGQSRPALRATGIYGRPDWLLGPASTRPVPLSVLRTECHVRTHMYTTLLHSRLNVPRCSPYPADLVPVWAPTRVPAPPFLVVPSRRFPRLPGASFSIRKDYLMALVSRTKEGLAWQPGRSLAAWQEPG